MERFKAPTVVEEIIPKNVRRRDVPVQPKRRDVLSSNWAVVVVWNLNAADLTQELHEIRVPGRDHVESNRASQED